MGGTPTRCLDVSRHPLPVSITAGVSDSFDEFLERCAWEVFAAASVKGTRLNRPCIANNVSGVMVGPDITGKDAVGLLFRLSHPEGTISLSGELFSFP